jgi:NAD(P)-dependent dehydrogenase (short-subunit alcohol dehydrogenase family)
MRILVAGAAGGIGSAVTVALAAAGHEVVATDVRVDALPSAAAVRLPLDVLDDASISSAVEQAGPIDGLVCCVGRSYWTPVEVASRVDLEQAFALNVIGPMQLARAVLPQWRARGDGLVAMLSSGAGRMTTPLVGWYAATKNALEAACEALRYEVGHLGVRVAVGQPGAIATDIASRRWWAESEDPYYAELIPHLIAALGRKNADPVPVEGLAEMIVRLVEDPAPRFRWPYPQSTAKAIRLRLDSADHEVEQRVRAQLDLPAVPPPTD